MPDNSLPNMMIQSKTIYRLPITNYHGAPGSISTLVERTLQIAPFLTNKPNFRKSQMIVSDFMIREYGQMDTWSSGKNKPNSKPIQSQYKANTKPIQSQYKAKQSQTNPIQTQFIAARPLPKPDFIAAWPLPKPEQSQFQNVERLLALEPIIFIIVGLE
jgi:hypothetical protein